MVTKLLISPLILAAVLVSSPAVRAEEVTHDVAGSKDHPRISRFKGAFIARYSASDFGQAELLLSNPNSKKKARQIEGKVTNIVYQVPAGHEAHEVYRSYEAELANAGFTTLYKCAGEKECGGYDFPGYLQNNYGFMGNVRPESQRFLAAQRHSSTGDSYVMLYAYFQPSDGTRAILTVVDAAPLNKGLVTVTAEAMARDISSEGRTAVYGVYFDTDSATLKPESDDALKEIANLLSSHAAMKVFIVGHTDSVGQASRNVDLSQKRAESVVKALVSRYHIDAKRLEGRGVGPLAPVASNRSEDGRAKNRRVELVER
jgi:OmpA-OmpF porin, OOP family